MGVVLTINVSCTERKNTAAITTVLGADKCFNAMNCHHAIDGSSIRADLCDANTATECGQAIFKAFDDYRSNPIKPPQEWTAIRLFWTQYWEAAGAELMSYLEEAWPGR